MTVRVHTAASIDWNLRRMRVRFAEQFCEDLYPYAGDFCKTGCEAAGVHSEASH